MLCAAPPLGIEYLLRPVSKSLVLLPLFSNLISLAVKAVSKVFLLLVLPTLESARYQQAWGSQQGPMHRRAQGGRARVRFIGRADASSGPFVASATAS